MGNISELGKSVENSWKSGLFFTPLELDIPTQWLHEKKQNEVGLERNERYVLKGFIKITGHSNFVYDGYTQTSLWKMDWREAEMSQKVHRQSLFSSPYKWKQGIRADWC